MDFQNTQSCILVQFWLPTPVLATLLIEDFWRPSKDFLAPLEDFLPGQKFNPSPPLTILPVVIFTSMLDGCKKIEQFYRGQ